MTAIDKLSAGASSALTLTWNNTNWYQNKHNVRRLQMRIAKAHRERKPGKASY